MSAVEDPIPGIDPSISGRGALCLPAKVSAPPTADPKSDPTAAMTRSAPKPLYAAGGNGIGVAGVCWKVKLLNAKFLGTNGGTTANAIKAVDYFTNLKKKGLNIVATNNSWGGGGYSTSLFNAIARANTAGILFIAAAGTRAVSCELWACYPAEYSNDNVIAVASITSTGALSSFSNYGATSIDLGAPGSGIYSTVPGSTKRKITSAYASYSGTSMSAPNAAGSVGLLGQHAEDLYGVPLLASTIHPGASKMAWPSSCPSTAINSSSVSRSIRPE